MGGSVPVQGKAVSRGAPRLEEQKGWQKPKRVLHLEGGALMGPERIRGLAMRAEMGRTCVQHLPASEAPQVRLELTTNRLTTGNHKIVILLR
jgi:hypothetical protein